MDNRGMPPTDSHAAREAIQAVTMLNIELNSSCNLRCRWCSLDHSRPRQAMEPATLERVMAEMAAGALPGLKTVDFHNGGETLLHPQLGTMLEIAGQARRKAASFPMVRLLTNAMALTEEKSAQILHFRAFDKIRFSVDGTSPAQYEEIRRGAKWEVLRTNVLAFLGLRARMGVDLPAEAICLVPEGQAEGFAPEFEAFLSLFDKVMLRHPHNWDGSVELGVDDASYRATSQANRGKCCFLLKRNLVVLPGGEVTVCCNDLNQRGVIGSVLDKGLAALAALPARLEMQDLHRRGRKAEVELCRNCSGFFAGA